MEHLSFDISREDEARLYRAMLAWETGDKPMLDSVMADVMANDAQRGNGTPRLLFAAISYATGAARREFDAELPDALRRQLLRIAGGE